MKIRNTFNTRSLTPAILVLAAATSAHAATFATGEWQAIGSVRFVDSNIPAISVTTGSEGYSTGPDGLTTGGLDGSFNGSIADYAFHTSTGGFAESLGGTADLITTTTAGVSTSNDAAGLQIWAGSDPASEAADQTVYSKPQVVNGTVDISGLTAGSLYMFFGTRDSGTDLFDISFSLTGGAGGTQTISQTVNNLSQDGIENNTFFVYRVDFADNVDYDALTFSYDYRNTTATARHRWGGVVLTAPVPEPSTALLGGLGVLFLLRRRRI